MECISWKIIEKMFKKREYKKFCKWMEGQTYEQGGVYVDDFIRYMQGRPVID